MKKGDDDDEDDSEATLGLEQKGESNVTAYEERIVWPMSDIELYLSFSEKYNTEIIKCGNFFLQPCQQLTQWG